MGHEYMQPVTAHPATNRHEEHKGRHRWMMVACCIPMLVIAIALVATGVLSPSFLIFAIVCTLMMATMMGGMDHGGSKH